jgi:selenocysteine lyase/cysteine desulfurase
MPENTATWLEPLAVLHHYWPLLPAADGREPGHWTMARTLCSIAERAVQGATPGPLGALELSEAVASTDELGRLLLHHLPFRDAAAQQAWPQVQAYLLQLLPSVERLLVAGTPTPRAA